MYNTDLPTRADLPTSAQLRRSTLIAAVGAAVLLVTIVLPSEYALDPTGIGRALGLTEMGEIKLQLAAEAAADAAMAADSGAMQQPADAAQTPGGKSDELSFVLTPGQGVEVKLVMKAGAAATYSWTAAGGPVNFDTHGEGNDQSISYDKGRGVAGDEGVLEAAFDGNHGWFWRNRSEQDVTVTLRTSGDYIEMKR